MNLLDEIKNRLLITGNFHDTLILGFIEDVKQYLVSAGVDDTIVNSKKAIGCIARGVNDLMNNETFSTFFNQRAIQLTMEEPTEEEPIPVMPPVVEENPEENPTDPETPEGNEGNGDNITDPDNPEDNPIDPEPTPDGGEGGETDDELQNN